MAKRTAPAAAGEQDGRQARSERSRQAIVAAMLALVGEGDTSPTAEQVAERARVGIRTVFRHFRDMESLFAAMDARIEAEVAPRYAGPVSAGTAEERLRELIARRCRLYEAIAPYKRAGALWRADSPFLRSRQEVMTRSLRVELRRALPELDGGSAERLEALDLVTSFEAWDRLRSEQRLGTARVQATLDRLALAAWRGWG